MNTYQLHDFVEDYPCQNDPEIQWKTAQRKEFNELESGMTSEKVNGRFFNHQELFLRYVRQYNRILNIQETGTGKSGSIINLAEFYKKNNENIKRVYIIQPGPATANDFKNQISKLSDENEYMNDKIKYANNAATATNNLTRLIKEWYSIETYQQFAKKNYSDSVIEEEFSDCIFFFDEAHKLRTLNDENNKIGADEINKIYNFIWRVCHIAKRSKIILATATPMINDTLDFVPLINLLLPMNFQLPFYKNKENFYDLVTLEQLEPYFRGKITFIKFLESNIEIRNIGEELNYEHKITMASEGLDSEPLISDVKVIQNNNIITQKSSPLNKQPLVKSIDNIFKSKTKIVKLEMSELQTIGYNASKKKNKSFFLSERQAAVFVYPNKMYGIKGFEYYTEKDELGEYVFKENEMSKYVNEQDLKTSLENIKTMSVKFHYYLSIEIEKSKLEKPGNSFCYLEFVNASGALLLGMLLTVFGFQEYRSNYSAFDLYTKKIIIDKGKRFALLTGKQGNLQDILNLFNSYENRHGEYIQMLIASEAARDGINVKSVLRGYIMTPGWHESGMHQALSRFIRADSHDYLFEESGKIPIVEIYRLCSANTVDEKLYIDSEAKNISSVRIINYMIECAFDGLINIKRNLGSLKKEDRSIELWSGNKPPPKSEYIYNTYYLYYTDNLVKKTKRKIIEKIKINFVMDYDLLKKETGDVDYIFNTAIQELILNNEIISNYQNTIFYTLKYNQSTKLIYLRRENLYNIKNYESTENSLYLDNEYSVLARVLFIGSDDEQIKDFYEKFSEVDEKTYENVKNFYIDSQNHLLFQKLLELALIKTIRKQTTDLDNLILKMLSNYYIITKKPSGYYTEVEKAFSKESEKKQGRRRGEESKAGLKEINLSEYDKKETDELIIVHFYRPTEETAFSINTIFETDNKNIKILNTNPRMEEEENIMEFRETDRVESYIYNFMFSEYYRAIMAPFKAAEYYGTYIMRGDSKTDIVEKEKSFFRIIDNTQDNSRGKQCTSFNIEKIDEILTYLDTNKKYANIKKHKKPVICPLLLDLFREKKLLFESF